MQKGLYRILLSPEKKESYEFFMKRFGGNVKVMGQIADMYDECVVIVLDANMGLHVLLFSVDTILDDRLIYQSLIYAADLNKVGDVDIAITISYNVSYSLKDKVPFIIMEVKHEGQVQ